MRIDALKYRNDNKQDIIIIIEFYCDYKNPIWRISDIKYKTSRQREYRYYSDTFKNNWDYRNLNLEERNKYAMKKFEDFVGREKLEEAVVAAWKNIKPDLGNIGTSNI